MDENWKIVPEHPLYEASDLGNVRSRRKVLAQFPDHSGRLMVKADGRSRYIHRMVGFAWVPKVPGKNHINHKDGNKLNNVPSNLEWCTNAENNRHAYDMGLKFMPSGEKNPNAKVTDLQVVEIRKSAMAAKELAVKYGVTQTHIYRIINGDYR